MSKLSDLPVDEGMLVAKLRRQLPQMLFAAYDNCPLTTAGKLDAGGRIDVFAVCCEQPSERMDAAVKLQLQALVRDEVVQSSARQLELKCPTDDLSCHGSSEELNVYVKWHDVVEFVALVHRRSPRSVEALTHPQPALFAGPEWHDLLRALTSDGCNALLCSKGYRAAYAGSAVSLTRRLKESSLAEEHFQTLANMCRRAAHGVSAELARRLDELEGSGNQSKSAWQDIASELLEASSKAPGLHKKDSANEALKAWLDTLLQHKFQEFVSDCAVYQATASKGCPWVSPCHGVELGTEWQQRLGAKWPDGAKLVLLTQTGSCLYNLQLLSSDTDYTIVYISTSEQLLSSNPLKAEFHAHIQAEFGSDKRGEIEFSGREIGHFVLDLAKGNPKNLEVLYADNICTSAPLWQELRDMRRCFITKRCAKQYVGFIGERLHKATSICEAAIAPMDAAHQNFQGTSGRKVSKCLYQAHHKMLDLTRILEGMEPQVALYGEERDFVMRIRLEPPQELREAQDLIKDAEHKLHHLSDKLKADSKLPEEVDAEILINWLHSVRVRQVLPAD